MPETAWGKTKQFSGAAYSKTLKPGFDKVYNTIDKLGAPINRLPNRLGAEAFWPTSLEKESDKAARILRSFCKDGFYAEVDEDEAQNLAAQGERLEGPPGKQRVLQRIPEQVIREAKGLAIFTTMRTGLWVSGAGGSGVLVARHQNTGEWSPPSGIMLHTAGLGFLDGVDIYDCVVVINSYDALETFTKIRCTLGGEVSTVAGPVGVGGPLETEIHKRQAPVWTYLKSRGLYAGVQVDGTIVIERADENESFYGERISVADILAGRARNPPQAKYRMLVQTIKAAQGEKVAEGELPAPGLVPGDLEIEPETSHFGIPNTEDPDPYGVRALQAEGLEIREAGTNSRPAAEVFEFKPATSSPIYSNFRKSTDLHERANSWRGSMHSIASVDKATQTDEEDSRSASHSPVKRNSVPLSPISAESEHVQESSDGEDQANGLEPSIQEQPRIEAAVPVVARARMVTVPKRVPPSLPPRNPNRVSPSGKIEKDGDGFDTVSLNGSESSNLTRETRESNAEVENGSVKSPVVLVDDKSHLAGRGAPGVPGDEEFHSVPPSPTKEPHQGIPGAF